MKHDAPAPGLRPPTPADGSRDQPGDSSTKSAAERDRLLALFYEEFRQIARRVLRDDGVVLQIQPTDLAHEAALRILKLDRIDWQGRTHFLSLSARVMRRLLIDEVRRFRSRKRQAPPVLTQWDAAAATAPFDLEALDAALMRLQEIDPAKVVLVEKRVFAGLSMEEIAAETGVSLSTVKRQWRAARAWLLKEIAPA